MKFFKKCYCKFKKKYFFIMKATSYIQHIMCEIDNNEQLIINYTFVEIKLGELLNFNVY